MQTDDAPGTRALDELLTTTRAASNPLATAMLISELIPDRFEYRQGATYVDSTIDHLLHLGRACARTSSTSGCACCATTGSRRVTCRAICSPTGSDDGRESVEVDTHAWLEALLPATDGASEPVWVGIDPTNRGRAGETHVKIGHGRHYADVPPVKGVYRGAATSELQARVTMTRLERGDPASIARS